MKQYKRRQTGWLFVALLAAVHRLWPAQMRWREQPYEFVHDHLAIDLLAGGPWLRLGVDADRPLAELVASWESAEASFCERRRRHLLYD